MRRELLVFSIMAVLLLSGGANALADGPPPEQVELEPSYFDGKVYLLAIPSAISHNTNQATFACFNLGPDLAGQQTGPYLTLYVILAPGATQVACPNGSLRHDHVLSGIPGTPGYVPRWHIVLATPGAAFDPSIMPLTTASDVEAALASGQLTLTDTGVVFDAPVLGQAGR